MLAPSREGDDHRRSLVALRIWALKVSLVGEARIIGRDDTKVPVVLPRLVSNPMVLAVSSLVIAMTNGIGAHLTNDEKRAHLTDLKREHLIDQSASKRFCRSGAREARRSCRTG